MNSADTPGARLSLKHKQTCTTPTLQRNHQACRLCPAPHTIGPIFDPDTSRSPQLIDSGSQSANFAADDLWGNNRERPPGPLHTSPWPGPRNSATVRFADWPNAAVEIHPNRDRANQFSDRVHGFPSG